MAAFSAPLLKISAAKLDFLGAFLVYFRRCRACPSPDSYEVFGCRCGADCVITGILCFLWFFLSLFHTCRCLTAGHVTAAEDERCCKLSPHVSPHRLEQGLPVARRLRGARRLLQCRGRSQFWPRGRRPQEAGESRREIDARPPARTADYRYVVNTRVIISSKLTRCITQLARSQLVDYNGCVVNQLSNPNPGLLQWFWTLRKKLQATLSGEMAPSAGRY